MRHPSNDMLYALARKVAAQTDLTPEEAVYMKHIAECDDCYHLLCSMMVMQDVAEHIGEFALDTAPSALRIPMVGTVSAVIRLAVSTVNSILDQLEGGDTAWTFRRAPMALAGTRSGSRSGGAIRKLADTGNSQTFVAYDPAKQLLVIQVDSAGCEAAPYASILLPGGEEIEVQFEKREDLFWAEVQGLQEGEYEILLEK